MDGVEATILQQLQDSLTDTASSVDLMVASQITGSESLYKQALKALIAADEKPNLEQAKSIGLETTYAILTATKEALVDTRARLAEAEEDVASTRLRLLDSMCPKCTRYRVS